MGKSEILAGVAVVALVGTFSYLSKVSFISFAHMFRKKSHISAAQAIASDDIAGAGGNPGAFISGPAIYAANSPWLFGANVGNVIPPNSAGVTLPGAVAADFLGFNTN